MNKLFPGEDPKDVLRIELKKLTVENYMQTVKDIRYPDRSEMREFGTTYNGCYDVYLKIRVELLGRYGKEEVLIMSFHFAEKPFDEHTFPYKEVRL